MPQSSTRPAYLVMPAHAADWCRGRRVCAKCLRSAGGVSPARTEIIPARLKRTKGRIRRGTLFLGGNLQTKLTRRSAGAVHLWLGYAGRSSGLGQPHQPATVTPAATRPLGSRRQPAVASTSQRWPAVIRPLTSMSGPRVRQDKSMPALPRPDGTCQATVPAAATSFFCLATSLEMK